MVVLFQIAIFLTVQVQGSRPAHHMKQEYKRNEHGSDKLSDGNHGSNLQQNNLTTLYLMAVAPYPDPRMSVGWNGGPGLIPAARLAVEQINKRLIDYRYQLALLEIDSGCNNTYKALLGYTNSLFGTKKNIVGMVGPVCSSSAIFLGKLSTSSRAPLVTVTIGTSRSLRNRNQYPYTFTAVSSADIYVQILLELASQHGWGKIGVVFSAYSSYFREILYILLDQAPRNLSITALPLYESVSPIAEIIESEVRIIVVLAPSRLTEKLMCNAYRNNPSLINPVYQWFFVERSHVTFGNTITGCSTEELVEAFENSVLFTYTFETRDRTSPIESGDLFDDFQTAYYEKVREHENETGLNIIEDMPYSLVYAPVYYDAAWVFGLALESVIQYRHLDLRTYRQPNSKESLQLAETLKDHIYNLTIKGASGTIKFDRDTGQGNSIIELFQVKNGTAVEVGYYGLSNCSNSSSLMCYNCALNFINDNFDERIVGMPLSIAVTELGITILLFILAIIFHILNTMYADHKSIKASSPYLNHLIFIGYYIMAIGIISNVLTHMYIFTKKEVQTSLCLTYQWEITIGLNLILATLCMKTWRIYRIFIHFQNPGGKLLTNPILVVFVVLLLIPIVVALMFLTFIDRNQVIWDTTSILTVTTKMPKFVKRGSCNFPVWFIVVDKLYSGFFLVCTLCLAILSRHISKRYRTIKSISALIYTQTVITGLGLPVEYITKAHVKWDLHHIVLCIYLEGLLLVYLIFLFMPPLIPMITEKWTVSNSSRRGSELSYLTAALRRASNVSFLFVPNGKS